MIVNKAVIVVGLTASLVTGVAPSHATVPSWSSEHLLASSQVDSLNDERLIDEASQRILDGFMILDRSIVRDATGKWSIDMTQLESYDVVTGDIHDVEQLVYTLNLAESRDKPLYRDRSWTSFGLCVVAGVTGIQVKEISGYVAWKEFGTYVHKKDWNKALNILKAGVRTYLAKHGAKAAGRAALKQIINASGVGFAAQAAAAAATCAVIEGWRWFWK